MELSVAGLSLTLLLGFTVMFFFESLDEAFSKQHHHKAAAEEGGGSGGRDDADENGDSANNADDEGETVNPQIGQQRELACFESQIFKTDLDFSNIVFLCLQFFSCV